MLTIYGLPQSRSTRVLWIAEECGLDYQFTALDFRQQQQRSKAYLRLNPAAKVPTLVDGELVLTESAAIVNYIAKRYGHGLIPDEPIGRAHYDRWSFFALSELEQPLWTMGKHRFALPSARRVPEILTTAAWEYQDALALLSQGLGERDFILGEQFSAVDVLLGHTLRWGVAFKQALEQDNLQHYLQRLNARDALQRALAREVRP